MLVQQRGLEGNVVFAGVVSDEEKAALYGGADVFVLPVREDGDDMEGFGLVFLEAGLHGLPSICGKSGGAADAVEDGRTGIHCDGRDIGGVHAALARLLSDDALRRRLGDAARVKAEANVWGRRIGELV